MREGSRKHRGEKKESEGFGKHTSLHYSLAAITIFTQQQWRVGPCRATSHYQQDRRKRGGSWEGGGGGAASVMAPVRSRGPYGPFPRCTLQPQNVSAVCLFQDLYRYKTEGCLFIFLPLGGNLDRHSTRGHAVASI